MGILKCLPGNGNKIRIAGLKNGLGLGKGAQGMDWFLDC